MPNEFIARNGVIALNNSVITGSLSVSSAITASNIISNTTLNANGTSATFNTSNTYINSSNILVGNDATDLVSLSGNTLYLPGNGRVGIGTTSPNVHLDVSGSSIISGSLTVVQGITGSLFGTSSWATNARTASNVLGGTNNYIPLWSGSSALTSSVIYQTNSNIVIEGSGSSNPPAPTGLSASFDYSGGNYFAEGYSFNYRVYSYKDSPIGRIYSTSYATLGADITDDGSFTSFNVLVSWTAVAGASGYRILLYNDYSGYNYDYGTDVTTNSYTDDDNGAPLSEPDTSLTATLNSVNIKGTVNITGSINLNSGSLFTITNDKNIVIGGNGNNYGINDNVFIGNNAGYQATNVLYSTFIGINSGYQATNASDSNFIGRNAGYQTTNANQSNFIGVHAGQFATNANNSNFIGNGAGYSAINAPYSNFIGLQAGQSATNATRSNFLGYLAGFGATNANRANFLGYLTGYQATSASYSTLIGYQVAYNPAGGALGIKSNNIIIGTNITLENGRQDSINLGGVIFGTGSYSNINTSPFSGSANGRIGINQPLPIFNLDVSGSGRYTSGLTITGSLTVITGSAVELQVTDTGVKIGNAISDIHTVTGSLNVSGSITATSFVGNGSGLTNISATVSEPIPAGAKLYLFYNY